jgi:multiple sugar transport system permease protein
MSTLTERPGAADRVATVAAVGRPRGRARGPRWQNPLVLLLASLLGVLFTYPFVWLVSASLKPRSQVFDNELIPDVFSWANYVTVWQEVPLATWLINTLLVGVAAAVTVTASSAFVAFGFAYFPFRGRSLVFGLVLATMMLPTAVTMIPSFLVWDALGFTGTQVPLWAGNLFGSAFYIFLLRQFFLTVPRDLFDAARVDGLGYVGLFWRIAVPLAKPALIITFVFELRASWSDLIKPLIFLRDTALYTLPLGLKTVLDRFGKGGELQWEVVLAASVVATVPMVLLFFVAQRYIVSGIATTAFRGPPPGVRFARTAGGSPREPPAGGRTTRNREDFVAEASRTVVDVIVEDHREFEELFRQGQAATDLHERRRIADQVIAEVVRHAVAEEEYLYPAFRQHLDDGDELADHEIEEHSEAERMMKELSGLDADDPRFPELFDRLIAELRHHIEDEEQDALPKLAQACPHEELVRLGEQVERAKKMAPTRPHPMAPDTPPWNKLLAPGAGLVDRVRDALSGRRTE